MRTGKICSQSGVYSCAVHPSYTITIAEGEPFPQCHRHKQAHDTRWVLVEPVPSPKIPDA